MREALEKQLNKIADNLSKSANGIFLVVSIFLLICFIPILLSSLKWTNVVLFIYVIICVVYVAFNIKREQKIQQIIDDYKNSLHKRDQEMLEMDAENEKWGDDVVNLYYAELNRIKASFSSEKAELISQYEQKINDMNDFFSANKAEITSRYEQELSSLRELYDHEIKKLNGSLADLSQYKRIVSECGEKYGTNAEGVIKRLHDSESLLSKSVNSLPPVVYEQYVGYCLEKEGWTKIQYTKTTGDHGGDITGIDAEGKKAVVQCKRYQGNAGIQAVQEALYAIQYYGCDKGYVCCTSGFTAEAREGANKVGIILKTIR